ncbi:MAG: pyridoxamine 5'-phosphate oxidase family protein [Actinobacteria bacterium]|nr:pyridoxamine 5'-phosphate oxidase family protein [Actinomycetota bacterium]
MSIPLVDRPEMPDGYGVKPDGAFLSWVTVEQRLIDSLHYWLSTTGPDGAPHVVPRWGVWLDGAFWYDGSPKSRHARNLETNTACALHLESGSETTILYGRSEPSSPVAGDLATRLSAKFVRKYAGLGYTPPPDAWDDELAGGLRILRPSKGLAWSHFPEDVTRFTFADSRP